MTLNDISDEIYVINLKRREDRKKHIIEQLKSIQCENYTIIEAVDYTNNTDTIFNIKNGAQGLSDTWKKIHKICKDSQSKQIIIIEDDCEFVLDFNKKLEQYLNHVPTDWHMLYFGANHNYHTGSTTQKINDWCLKLNNTYSAHCIALRKDFFFKAISYINNTKIEVDLALSHFQKDYNAYSPTQKLTNQMPGFSDIENKWVDYSNIIL